MAVLSYDVTDSLREKAQVLYLEGKRVCYISQELGIKSQLISMWANRFHWVEMRRNLTKRVEKAIERTVTSAMVKESTQTRQLLANEATAQAKAFTASPCTSYGELVDTKEGKGRASTFKTVVEASSVVFGWKDQANGLGGPLSSNLRDLDDSIDVTSCGVDTTTGSVPSKITDSSDTLGIKPL